MDIFFNSASQNDCLHHLRFAFFYLKRHLNRLLIWFIALLNSLPYLTPTPFSVDERNNGVHLAVVPICGSLIRGSRPSDINVGIELGNVTILVSFGVSEISLQTQSTHAVKDSYTDGGNDDGSPLEPPVLIPPSVLAGGRSANGPVWIEGIANNTGATLMSYAVSSLVFRFFVMMTVTSNGVPASIFLSGQVTQGKSISWDKVR